jgi:hypothetical protein
MSSSNNSRRSYSDDDPVWLWLDRILGAFNAGANTVASSDPPSDGCSEAKVGRGGNHEDWLSSDPTGRGRTI